MNEQPEQEDKYCDFGPCETVLGVSGRIAKIRNLIVAEISIAVIVLVAVGFNTYQINKQRTIARTLMDGVVLTQNTRLKDHAEYLILTREYNNTLAYIAENIIGKDERNEMLESDKNKESALRAILETHQRIEARLTEIERNTTR